MLEELLVKHHKSLAPMLPIKYFYKKACPIDLSKHNPDLKRLNPDDYEAMETYIFDTIRNADAYYGIGGYGEERDMYERSEVFATGEGESRSIHLGIDVWVMAGERIATPLDAEVHSFANNDSFGDYGATIVLAHELEGVTFYTLYGHLSLESIEHLSVGYVIPKGTFFCTIGDRTENGNWVPHLHFQIIKDMQGKQGDFIGVAPKSEKDYYLDLCPDANLLWIGA
ncbi:MAG: peptidoglycan DD-metalloendopeptidase family protein [Bernardetiaceae bacterium]|nr:peptidoglycan DD-metalloendopeptidase family protein [Bernardetiaceae bacterium]